MRRAVVVTLVCAAAMPLAGCQLVTDFSRHPVRDAGASVRDGGDDGGEVDGGEADAASDADVGDASADAN